MKALILAAGRGTRVKPITYTIPKPMIPILNKPVMEILVDLLRQHGVRQIMVNTSYLATAIENYFRDGSRFGVEMAYSFEGYVEGGRIVDEPVGSAGAIKKIQTHSGFFDETFFVLCGDALIDVNLTELVSFHRARKALATIALSKVPKEQVCNYGVVVTDENGRVLDFQEKPPAEKARSTTVNTGIYVFEPEIIERIPTGTSYDIGGQLFPRLAAEKTDAGRPSGLYGTVLPFEWLDIGKVTDYYYVMQQAVQGQVRGLRMPGTQVAEGIWTGINVRLDLSASRITPPVYVGGSSSVAPGATIVGPTMIGAGCFVESGAHIERSIVFDYTRVGPYAHVSDMIVCGNYCVKASGEVVDLGASDIDWVIADARSRLKALTQDQLELMESMQRHGVQ